MILRQCSRTFTSIITMQSCATRRAGPTLTQHETSWRRRSWWRGGGWQMFPGKPQMFVRGSTASHAGYLQTPSDHAVAQRR
jgi:hypothetical protein